MYKFIVELCIFGRYCNIFNRYIIAHTEEIALNIADELLSSYYNGNCRLSDFTYRVNIISEKKFKVVFKAKRKNARRHVVCTGEYGYCTEYIRYLDMHRYDVTIEDFNGNVIKHCK